MSIFRPTAPSGGTKAPYLGFKEINFLSVEEADPMPDWADIYWNIECEIEGSQYTNKLRISGSLERDPDGNLVDCGLLKRLYYFLDCIGFDGGLDIKGNWVTGAGDPIPNVIEVINRDYMKKPDQKGFMAFAYIYKEAPKDQKDKPFTKIQSKVVQNTPEGRKDLESYIKFMKEKNHIRELSETNQPTRTSSGAPF